MNKPEITSEQEKVDDPRQAGRTSKISLWTGILAAAPYLCIIPAYWWHDLYLSYLLGTGGVPFPIDLFKDVFWTLAFISLFPGFICGFPFGLVAVVTGINGITKQSKTKGNATVNIIGILLGIGGIFGHIWYFVTCQFCQ